MTDTYTLPRDGARPVRFVGELIAEERGAVAHAKEQNRYYDLALYQLEDRRYLVQWAYCTRWQGEESHNAVQTCATMDEAITLLEAFDPCQWVEGYKAIIARHPEYARDGVDSPYAKRQEELERTIRARYRAQVSALCARLGYVEEL